MTTATSPQSLHPPRKPDEENDDQRVYKGVAYASTNYVSWVLGSLRVNKFDLSRMTSSGVPVLRAHQHDRVVGAVTRCFKDNDLFRADWRIPKRPFTADTLDAMDTAVLRGISVGGNIVWETLELDNPEETSFDKALFSCDVLLIEQSLVATPADVTSGIDREATAVLERDGAIFDSVISTEGITTRQTPALLERLQGMVKDHNKSVAIRRQEGRMTTLDTIPKEAIERAIAEQLERSESLKALTQLPGEITRLSETLDAESKRNMEYRAKLDQLQFQPTGRVLQHGNWTPNDPLINLGVVLRLTREDDSILPAIANDTVTTFEESIIERAELSRPGRDTLARIPWAALAEYESQQQLRRAAMTDGAGVRPLGIDYLGDGGLVLNSWSPILGRMNVRLGVEGGQKLPWATAQPTAAAGVEGSDITVTNLTLSNVEHLPVSIASAYEITSSLRAVDDGVFESIARMAITDILLDQVTDQILVGGGTNQISGLWGTTGVKNVDYGAAQVNFDRDDVLDWYDHVRLSKTDGGMFTAVMGDGLWQLCERTPRGTDGTSSAGYTEISMYLLEPTAPHEGRMEREMAYHYKDFAPSGTNDAALFFKADRIMVWFWGQSLNLEYVPQTSRKDTFKMIAEVNYEAYRPVENVSRIKRT